MKTILLCITMLTAQFVMGQTSLLQKSGKISFLRIHEVNSKYGPANDQISGEVVIKLKGNTRKAYGFKLRKDNNELTHQGMLDLLSDAFNYGHRVTIDFNIKQGKNNGEIIRVWLTK